MIPFVNRFKKAFSVATMVAACALGTAPSVSHATVVWDPTNFVENLISATESVLIEANTYESMVNTAKQTIAFAKSVTTLDGLADLAGVSEELDLYRELSRTSMELYNTLQASKSAYQSLQSQWAASNFTWKDFLAGQSAIQTGRVNSLVSQFENANRSVERVAQRRQKLLDKAQQAGANESMMQITQVVSGQLDMIAGQNQQVVQMMAQKLANDAGTEQDRINGEDLSWEIQRTRQKKLQDAANALH